MKKSIMAFVLVTAFASMAAASMSAKEMAKAAAALSRKTGVSFEEALDIVEAQDKEVLAEPVKPAVQTAVEIPVPGKETAPVAEPAPEAKVEEDLSGKKKLTIPTTSEVRVYNGVTIIRVKKMSNEMKDIYIGKDDLWALVTDKEITVKEREAIRRTVRGGEKVTMIKEGYSLPVMGSPELLIAQRRFRVGNMFDINGHGDASLRTQIENSVSKWQRLIGGVMCVTTTERVLVNIDKRSTKIWLIATVYAPDGYWVTNFKVGNATEFVFEENDSYANMDAFEYYCDEKGNGAKLNIVEGQDEGGDPSVFVAFVADGNKMYAVKYGEAGNIEEKIEMSSNGRFEITKGVIKLYNEHPEYFTTWSSGLYSNLKEAKAACNEKRPAKSGKKGAKKR